MAWYSTVTRWSQTNLTELDPLTYDSAFWKDYWKRMHIGGVIINAAGIVAYYPSSSAMQYRAAGLGERDLFGQIAADAKEMGLAVIARMDCNRADDKVLKAHPEWFCVDRDGKPYPAQNRYFTCVNTDYYRKHIVSVMKELLERYPIDGFSDNSWSGMRQYSICYCNTCKLRFRKDTGHEIPTELNWEDPVFRAYVRWSFICRDEIWQLYDETAQRYGGPDCRWIGMVNADPANPAGHYVSRSRLLKDAKMVFCDHQTRSAVGSFGFEENTLNGMLLHDLCGEDKVVTESTAHYVSGARTFRIAAMPAQETLAWAASGMAGGISPWVHHISAGTEDRRKFATSLGYYDWHHRNDQYLRNRALVADTYLCWSEDNAEFYGRDHRRERVSYPLRGFTAALVRAGLSFGVLHADHITQLMEKRGEDIRNCTLVLPNLAALTDEQETALCAYLSAGGNLLMTGASGLMDQDGEPRKSSKLWSMLGLQDQGLYHSATVANGSWENSGNHTYFSINDRDPVLLHSFEDTDILPFGGQLRRIENTGDLKAYCAFMPSFPIYPPELCTKSKPDDSLPLLFAGKLTSGSRVVVFAGDIDRCYGEHRLPDHGQLLENALNYTHNGCHQVQVTSEGNVLISCYKQDKRTLLHLVNLSGLNEKPGYLEKTVPLRDIEVMCNKLSIKKAYSTATETELACLDGKIHLPELKLFDMLICE